MGYSCHINSDKEIIKSEIQTVKEVVVIRRYTLSGSIVDTVINHFVSELGKNGHKTTCEMSMIKREYSRFIIYQFSCPIMLIFIFIFIQEKSTSHFFNDIFHMYNIWNVIYT